MHSTNVKIRTIFY